MSHPKEPLLQVNRSLTAQTSCYLESEIIYSWIGVRVNSIFYLILMIKNLDIHINYKNQSSNQSMMELK